MYNLKETITKQAVKKPSPQQLQQIVKTQQYLRKHKIHEIYNELLARIIQTRPDKIKQHMIQILRKIKQKSFYFKKQDFQHMFESYDVFEDQGNNQVSYMCLIQALDKIGIQYQKQDFLNNYPQFKLQKGIKKSDFVSIMEKQYKKKVHFE